MSTKPPSLIDVRNALQGKQAPRVGIDRPLMIGFLSGDMLHSDFALSLTLLVSYSIARCSYWVGINRVQTSLVHQGRNWVVQQFLANAQASHLLFIDSDMRFPQNALEQLVKRDLDIVGATYSMRRPPFALTHRTIESRTDFQGMKNGLLECNSLGCGLLLIKREVLEKMPAPWFRNIDMPTDKEPCKVQSEDITFCHDARALGYRVWCDVELSRDVQHVGAMPFEIAHVQEVYEGNDKLTPDQWQFSGA